MVAVKVAVDALCVPTSEVLPDAQCQAILGPLDDARVVEDHAEEDDPLATHHRLVRRLLGEPGRPHWESGREGDVEITLCTPRTQTHTVHTDT